MKVLATDERDIKQVIVGQKNTSEAFRIANTPAMMNILSSSLYENPLKAIVREIMFNAWDAQKDNGKSDQPIEVTVNIDNGILIRDHGKGLAQDKIHEIYCVYGASTKVEVKEATGGFGFGTKAPFSYADSFTVISYHDGVKSVNLINKIGEDNGGKPDRTLMVQVPTEESGIAVTVGLKNIEDVEKIVNHVKSLMYLSGMKVKFTYNLSENNDPGDEIIEELEGKEIMPNEIVIRKSSDDYSTRRYRDDSGIYAVYGGVRYRIPDNEIYQDAYKQLRIFTRNDGAVYFGFAPDTLTPQPSRDGLNMSELSINSIREIISTTSEEISDLVDEGMTLALKAFLEAQAEINIQPHYVLDAAYRWYVNKSNIDLDNFNINLKEYADARITDRTDNYSWYNLLNIVSKEIGYIILFSTFSKEKRRAQLFLEFIKCFPEAKSMVFAMKEYINDDSIYYRNVSTFLARYVTKIVLSDLHVFETRMEKEVENARHLPSLRFKGNMDSNNIWHKTIRDRTLVPKLENEHADAVWTTTRGKIKEVVKLLMTKKILIVQTASRLEVTNYIGNRSFSSDDTVNVQKYHRLQSYSRERLELNRIIPAYVIPKAKGTYDKAKAILIEMGYDVIEIVEEAYETKEKIAYVPQVIENYKLDPTRYQWYDGQTMVEKPEFYIKINSSKVGKRDGSPNGDMMNEFVIRHPNSVMCTTIREEKAMITQGASDIVDWFIDWTQKLMKDKILMRKLIRYHAGNDEVGDYSSIFKVSDAFYKEIGVNLGTMTKAEFQHIYTYFNYMLESEYVRFLKVSHELNTLVESLKTKDNRLKRNKKFFKQMTLINNNHFFRKLLKLDSNDDAGREAMCRKVIKFVKTF